MEAVENCVWGVERRTQQQQKPKQRVRSPSILQPSPFQSPFPLSSNCLPGPSLTHATGLVRSPLPTTALQVASRLILLHFVVSPFPARTTTSPFYASMLLAWSVTEVVRYGYFVFALRGGGAVPGWLTWARYNGFFVLYPVGIGSEMVMVWRAMGGMGRDGRVVGWTVLGLYVPGEYSYFRCQAALGLRRGLMARFGIGGKEHRWRLRLVVDIVHQVRTSYTRT